MVNQFRGFFFLLERKIQKVSFFIRLTVIFHYIFFWGGGEAKPFFITNLVMPMIIPQLDD